MVVKNFANGCVAVLLTCCFLCVADGFFLSSSLGSLLRSSRASYQAPEDPSELSAPAYSAGSFLGRYLNAYTASPSQTVRFDLFTRQEPSRPTRVYASDKSSVLQSTYDPKKPTKFAIHGFLAHQAPGTGGYELKDAFLNVEDCNVIVVDWSAADPHVYNMAIMLAVPRVGSEIARLIGLFNSLGADLQSFHILGHSLGGQIAGEAGRLALGPTGAGRITGLDPAGPFFEGMPAETRLDPTDAGYVEVVHSDGGFLGYAQPTGHADFYPKGGMHVIAGCEPDYSGLCSHCLAYDFYLDALRRPGANVFRKCASWQTFQAGECSANEIANMGLNADLRSRGAFFGDSDVEIRDVLKENPLSPYLTGSPPQDPVARLHC